MKRSLNWNTLLLAPVMASVLTLLAACGGANKDTTTTTTPTTPTTPTPTLVSIAVTPANPIIALGLTQQMTATGTYSDNKTSAITTGLTWSIKGSNLSVNSAGLVTAKGVGSDTVTATVGNVSGSTDVVIRGQWEALALGGNHTLARNADGTLYSWGWNRQGQLGDTTTIDHAKPALVTGGVSIWRQVAVGELHTLALQSDGTLWAWGYNQNGQLGDGTTVDKSTPVKIGKDFVFVAAGKSHSMAINKDGALYTWGRNFNGQLGDGTKIDRLVPTKLVTNVNITVNGKLVPLTWTSAAAGASHSLARGLDGSLYVFGGNAKSQLGNGGVTDVSTPAKVGTATWTSIAAGGTHSLAVRSDGTLWAWGDASSGQLGVATTNTAVTATAPTQVGTASNWASIAAGQAHSLATRTDGTLYGWGSNSNGQVGNDSTIAVPAPVQIGTATAWVSVGAGLQHSGALQKDNTVWLWGRNKEGQQGNGLMDDLAVPTQLK